MKKNLVKLSFVLMVGSIVMYFVYCFNNVEEEVVKEKKIEEFFVSEEEVSEENEVIEKSEDDYVMLLEIPYIGLKQGVYDKYSYKNNVNLNVYNPLTSDYPDKVNGTLVLASHTGNTSASYFRNLYKLYNGLQVYVYYNGVKYVYEIVNYYEIEKTGKAVIKRDDVGNFLALITCKNNVKDKQIVYIAKLVNQIYY